MERSFETSYSQDYTHRLENRELALQHKIDANLPGSCFSPPFECTVPVAVADSSTKNINFESEVKRKEFSKCGANRFVKNLAMTHPELYADMVADQPWKERAGNSSFKSSYQLDYDRLPESAPCRLNSSSEHDRWPDWKYFQRDCNDNPLCNSVSAGPHSMPCSCQLCPPASEEDTRRTPRYGCVYAISSIPKSYIISSHWPERDWQRGASNRTEYRDNVGRLGGVLQRANVHDHSRCTPERNCRHKFFL
ncbi:uncharacterized protein LOC126558876 [Anopheles maculipalpis]|uniref:uncharacterized protein LOC126558876 n=1 Tax=Anopheles maculipalpis TaxID=1496333 RepID=UPI002159A133|nr:uncharacterized protein LOC126558876 [Anopheles maculipalpis]